MRHAGAGLCSRRDAVLHAAVCHRLRGDVPSAGRARCWGPLRPGRALRHPNLPHAQVSHLSFTSPLCLSQVLSTDAAWRLRNCINKCLSLPFGCSRITDRSRIDCSLYTDNRRESDRLKKNIHACFCASAGQSQRSSTFSSTLCTRVHNRLCHLRIYHDLLCTLGWLCYLGIAILGIEPGHADSRSVLHSFAVTEHYVVLVMTPAAIKPMKLLVDALTPTLAA